LLILIKLSISNAIDLTIFWTFSRKNQSDILCVFPTRVRVFSDRQISEHFRRIIILDRENPKQTLFLTVLMSFTVNNSEGFLKNISLRTSDLYTPNTGARDCREARQKIRRSLTRIHRNDRE